MAPTMPVAVASPGCRCCRPARTPAAVSSPCRTLHRFSPGAPRFRIRAAAPRYESVFLLLPHHQLLGGHGHVRLVLEPQDGLALEAVAGDAGEGADRARARVRYKVHVVLYPKLRVQHLHQGRVVDGAVLRHRRQLPRRSKQQQLLAARAVVDRVGVNAQNRCAFKTSRSSWALSYGLRMLPVDPPRDGRSKAGPRCSLMGDNTQEQENYAHKLRDRGADAATSRVARLIGTQHRHQPLPHELRSPRKCTNKSHKASSMLRNTAAIVVEALVGPRAPSPTSLLLAATRQRPTTRLYCSSGGKAAATRGYHHLLDLSLLRLMRA